MEGELRKGGWSQTKARGPRGSTMRQGGGDFASVKELLTEDPALVAVRDTDGNTLLHLAATSTNTDLMALLLKSGINIDIGNSRGQTPLHFAAWDGATPAVEWLLEHGADVFAEDEDGNTPEGDAREAGHRSTAELLSEAERLASDLSEYEDGRTAAPGYQDTSGPAIRDEGVLNEDKLRWVLDEGIASVEQQARNAFDKLLLAYLIDNEDLDEAYTEGDYDRVVNDGFLAQSGCEERIAALAFYQRGYADALRGVLALLQGEPSSITAPPSRKFVGAYDDSPDLSDLTNKQKATLKWLLRFSPNDLDAVIKNFRKREWG